MTYIYSKLIMNKVKERRRKGEKEERKGERMRERERKRGREKERKVMVDHRHTKKETGVGE